MDKEHLSGTWVSHPAYAVGSAELTFVFTIDNFDPIGKLLTWRAQGVYHLISTDGWCFNAVLTLEHRCDVVTAIDTNTVEMIDRKTSCSAVNLPVSGNCSGTVTFGCGEGLSDHIYRVSFDEISDTLTVIQVSHPGEGGEYNGVFTRAPSSAVSRPFELKSLHPESLKKLSTAGIA